MDRITENPTRSAAVEQIRRGLELTRGLYVASLLWGNPTRASGRWWEDFSPIFPSFQAPMKRPSSLPWSGSRRW